MTFVLLTNVEKAEPKVLRAVHFINVKGFEPLTVNMGIDGVS